ncbi:PepSY domain-containing protein [Maricaulis sp.]|uniref:PepSY domain-containing protein n=1 Tax=Maricaulis sp. TaxID=1486257 RepID=UPI003A90901E
MLRTLIIIAAAFTALGVPAVTHAEAAGLELNQGRDVRDRYTPGEARVQREQGNLVPAIRVIGDVRQRYPNADVLDVELEGGSAPRYIVKILTADGRRIDVVADARTGNILSER